MGAIAAIVEENCREKLASLVDAVLEEDTEALVRVARGSMRCCAVSSGSDRTY